MLRIRTISTLLSFGGLAVAVIGCLLSFYNWSGYWYSAQARRLTLFQFDQCAFVLHLEWYEVATGPSDIQFGGNPIQRENVTLSTIPLWYRGDGTVTITIPLIYPILIFAILPVLWLLPYHRRRRRKKLGLCQKCGYSLTELAVRRCPECGTWEERRRPELE